MAECLCWVVQAVFTVPIQEVHRSPCVLYYLPHSPAHSLASQIHYREYKAPSTAAKLQFPGINRKIFLMTINIKILEQNCYKWIPTIFLKDCKSRPTEFFLRTQAWFSIWKSINVIYYINKLKNKYSILIDPEKAFVKIQIHSWLKTKTNKKTPRIVSN